MNPRFDRWPTPRIERPLNHQEFCEGWFVEFARRPKRGQVVLSAADADSGRGLRIEVSAQVGWVRIWQPFDLTDAQEQPYRRLQFRAGAGDHGDLALSWVALVRENEAGKRVRAKHIYRGKQSSSAWRNIDAPFRVDSLGAETDHRLALEFTGTGQVVIDTCEVTVATPPPVADGDSAESEPPASKGGARARPKVRVRVGMNRPSASNGSPQSDPARRRRRVAVVGWDLGHNPAGRAFVLADVASEMNDVELVGPLFPAYGGRLWPPIAEQDRFRITTFPATDLRSLVERASAVAARTVCDVVYASKPRLPALLLAALIRHANGCPMIIDVDDRETSFFPPGDTPTLEELAGIEATDPERIATPYSDVWTRFCERLVGQSDGVTVSNLALQREFGGTIIRHARDERVFDPTLYDRESVRAEFGFGPADRVVLFLGTPRPHKGVFVVADAMERLDLPGLALCVIGSINDRRVSSRFDGYHKARIALNPDQPWARLPELVSMADAVMILQDPSSPISQHQIPAKLTDALALGVPVYATPVPPLDDLIQAGAVTPIDGEAALDQALRQIAAGPPATLTSENPSRRHFLAEFSYATNSTRLEGVVEEALASKRDDLPAFNELFEFLEHVTDHPLPRFQAPATRGRRQGRLPKRSGPPDLVYLWKQNDSDIYGRRPDMLTKYLLSTGRVRRILHLDAPIAPGTLDALLRQAEGAVAHQGKHVYVNTVRRVLRMADEPNLVRRTFVHRDENAPERVERFLGRELPPKQEYANFVRACMQEAGIAKDPLLLVSPVILDYEVIRDAVQPSLVIADVVDDQRQWPTRKEELRRRRIEAYETILTDADVAICNCEPLRESFAHLRADMHVIPNGLDLFPDASTWRVPPELEALPRPIIGYVGNLRDRVDFDLIRGIAEKYPQASLVLIGSAHDTTHPEDFADVQNVHFLGVRPYDEAVRHIRAFDVAIMPHVSNELSRSMNPLKLYVYFSLDVPVVATSVANIDDFAGSVAVGRTHDEFMQKLDLVLSGRMRPMPDWWRRRMLSRLSWDQRVTDIWALLPGGDEGPVEHAGGEAVNGSTADAHLAMRRS